MLQLQLDSISQVIESAISPPSVVKIRFLTIWFGANDARLPNTPDFPQHVPLEQYAENLRKIVSYCIRTQPDARIILVTPPPVEESIQEEVDRAAYADMKGLRRTATANAAYAVAVRELASELRLPCLDIWTVMITKAGYDPHKSTVDLPGSKSLGRNETLARLQRDGRCSKQPWC